MSTSVEQLLLAYNRGAPVSRPCVAVHLQGVGDVTRLQGGAAEAGKEAQEPEPQRRDSERRDFQHRGLDGDKEGDCRCLQSIKTKRLTDTKRREIYIWFGEL